MNPVERQRILKKYEKREHIREEYEKNRIKVQTIRARNQDIYDREDKLNLPRHHTNCRWFEECPIDYKCKAYNPTYLKCQNCHLHNENGICHKKELHNEKNCEMMIARPRINLDEENEEMV